MKLEDQPDFLFGFLDAIALLAVIILLPVIIPMALIARWKNEREWRRIS